jgi:hypothetical protein
VITSLPEAAFYTISVGRPTGRTSTASATRRSFAPELATVRHEYNTVRLHAGIGYVTPADEHDGRGGKIRAARERGLRQTRWARIAYHRIKQAKANRRSSNDVD